MHRKSCACHGFPVAVAAVFAQGVCQAEKSHGMLAEACTSRCCIIQFDMGTQTRNKRCDWVCVWRCRCVYKNKIQQLKLCMWCMCVCVSEMVQCVNGQHERCVGILFCVSTPEVSYSRNTQAHLCASICNRSNGRQQVSGYSHSRPLGKDAWDIVLGLHALCIHATMSMLLVIASDSSGQKAALSDQCHNLTLFCSVVEEIKPVKVMDCAADLCRRMHPRMLCTKSTVFCSTGISMQSLVPSHEEEKPGGRPWAFSHLSQLCGP